MPPASPGRPWAMVYSAWQDRPGGWPEPAPPVPRRRCGGERPKRRLRGGVDRGGSVGYRSRLFVATSADGDTYTGARLVVEGDGYGGADLDAVHAEDMSLLRMPDGTCACTTRAAT